MRTPYTSAEAAVGPGRSHVAVGSQPGGQGRGRVFWGDVCRPDSGGDAKRWMTEAPMTGPGEHGGGESVTQILVGAQVMRADRLRAAGSGTSALMGHRGSLLGLAEFEGLRGPFCVWRES